MKRTIGTTIGLLLLAACIIGAGSYIHSHSNRYPTPEQLARQAVWSKRWAQIADVLSYSCMASIILAIALAAIAAYYGIRWIRALVAQQEEIHAKSGVFPLVVRKTWTWRPLGKVIVPVQVLTFVDPNRSPAPVLSLYGGTSDMRLQLPETIPPEQRAIAHGAQVIQASSAAKHLATPGLGGFLDALPVQPSSLLTSGLPEIEIVEDSHIQRLLDEAGVLEPDRRLPQ